MIPNSVGLNHKNVKQKSQHNKLFSVLKKIKQKKCTKRQYPRGAFLVYLVTFLSCSESP